MSAKRRRKRRCKVQAPIKHVKRREFWRENHTPLWLLIGRIIFLIREKTSFAILIGRRLRLSLAKTHLRMKIYDIAFSWVFLSMYIIKYCIGFFVIHFPLGYFDVRRKIGSGLCPIPLRDCLRDKFCPSVLCNLVAPNKRSYSVPHCPIVQLAISEFQKFSLLKRGYVKNCSWVVSHIFMRTEAPFHISGSYLASPWKKGLGNWEMTHSKAPTQKSHGRCKECNHHQQQHNDLSALCVAFCTRIPFLLNSSRRYDNSN